MVLWSITKRSFGVGSVLACGASAQRLARRNEDRCSLRIDPRAERAEEDGDHAGRLPTTKSKLGRD